MCVCAVGGVPEKTASEQRLFSWFRGSAVNVSCCIHHTLQFHCWASQSEQLSLDTIWITFYYLTSLFTGWTQAKCTFFALCLCLQLAGSNPRRKLMNPEFLTFIYKEEKEKKKMFQTLVFLCMPSSYECSISPERRHVIVQSAVLDSVNNGQRKWNLWYTTITSKKKKKIYHNWGHGENTSHTKDHYGGSTDESWQKGSANTAWPHYQLKTE